MKTKLITPPASEPILLSDAKLHLRIESSYTADDTYISTLLSVAREYVESITNRKLITQTWEAYLTDWPRSADYISLPFGSLQSVTSVVYIDSDGTSHTWPNTEYTVESTTEPGRIVLNYMHSWPSVTLHPSNPIQIQFVCGYGANGSAVPMPIIHAIKLMISDMYEQREPFVVGRNYIPTNTINMLLFPYRIWSFG